MKEKLSIRSFGPIPSLDIQFEKVTIIIGDQGTGKSCIAKLFSLFKWLEKTLLMGKCDTRYYSLYERFKKKLCAYHRMDSFVKEDSYIRFETEYYVFLYEEGEFTVTEKQVQQSKGLSKIMYVPAERCYLSSAESGVRKSLGLPESCATFNMVFGEAKIAYKNGYALPFGEFRFEYQQLNETSYIIGEGYKIRLSDASSGMQSALPLCIVSEYLGGQVSSGVEREISETEKEDMRKQINAIMDNENYSETVKDALLKRLSAKSKYNSFINIVEEPELNMFPNSQLPVIKSLVKVNNLSSDNMLVVTTHSPYLLAIVNMLIMASNVSSYGEMWKKEVNEIESSDFHISEGDIVAYGLNESESIYCRSIIDEKTGMISINELDVASEFITSEFNKLYRLNGKAIRDKK